MHSFLKVFEGKWQLMSRNSTHPNFHPYLARLGGLRWENN